MLILHKFITVKSLFFNYFTYIFILLSINVTTPLLAKSAPVYRYQVVNVYPHDPEAYTQGLVYLDGFLYEGTGLHGKSTLRKVDLASGTVLEYHELPDQYFGEGIAVFDDRIIQLTWQSQTGFYYERNTFTLVEKFYYPTEGWGITYDDKQLIMSDGTATLHFLDPETFTEMRSVEVTDDGKPVGQLNELEFIHGDVFANVWPTDQVVRINPETGEVLGWINLKGLLRPEDRHAKIDVLNGIAYDSKKDRLFVTGKFWPKLFEIKLVPK